MMSINDIGIAFSAFCARMSLFPSPNQQAHLCFRRRNTLFVQNGMTHIIRCCVAALFFSTYIDILIGHIWYYK